MHSNADAAALYDLQNPWDPERLPSDRFFHEHVMAAESILDVGCGTGAMLAHAREHGHVGRLVGLDPDRLALDRARRRTDVEWVEGTAADARWESQFDLVTMTGHAFQCLVTDLDLRTSLTAIYSALREGGKFVFESRHPQARAWDEWTPSNQFRTVDAAGRTMLGWHKVDSIVGAVVTFNETTAEVDGTVLTFGRTSLRFLSVEVLGIFLVGAGFEIEAQYGDWHREPVTEASREIITIVSRPYQPRDSEVLK
jgi:SAM-dependent methyltransferase